MTGDDPIARVGAPGRIVLEDAATVLGRSQAAVAAGEAERGVTGSLADALLAERRADRSLEVADGVGGHREDAERAAHVDPDAADGPRR